MPLTLKCHERLINEFIRLYGPTFHASNIDLCIVFQCKLNKSLIMSRINKLVGLI